MIALETLLTVLALLLGLELRDVLPCSPVSVGGGLERCQ